MTVDDTPKRPWAVLAYTVADDKSSGGALDRPAQKELKAICDAADFGRLRVAAQVDFKSSPGVFRAVLEESEPRAFEDIDASEHPLWRSVEAKLARSKLRVQKEQVDLNAARGRVLKTFLRYGHRECAADRYLVSFYGHAYGPMGLFYDNDQDGPESTSLGPARAWKPGGAVWGGRLPYFRVGEKGERGRGRHAGTRLALGQNNHGTVLRTAQGLTTLV